LVFISQNVVFIIVTAVKTSNLASMLKTQEVVCERRKQCANIIKTLKIEATLSSEASSNFHSTILLHIPDTRSDAVERRVVEPESTRSLMWPLGKLCPVL
jgi:hypothetical protein